ncbi:hypothetical protein [Rhizobium sp. Root1212]|uniref:hypothetical protein n=1 Tax=unclassified Rhizobium TaxID=2613769 RepID=UPI000AE8750C
MLSMLIVCATLTVVDGDTVNAMAKNSDYSMRVVDAAGSMRPSCEHGSARRNDGWQGSLGLG